VNRLSEATSPYLLQHASNPVHWRQWDAEAFAEAERRDVPVLISVGYAACHWCHVMAHESFEDEGIAELVNPNFVAIKVDREERPDVDAVYMTATQALTGQGGWPMTVFATPQGQPFFAGTYYPRHTFAQLLNAVITAWQGQREAVIRQSAEIVAALAASHRVAAGTDPVTPEVLAGAVDSLTRTFDATYGGFGGAPKFPPHLVMLFLLRHHQRTGDPRALEMARATGEQMARGGIYDQVAGGFARYAVDGTWTVPHFEKMLYDNALLLRVYTDLWRLSGDELAARVARETAAFMLDDLGTAEGGLAASLDADTEGVEGATYVWTPDQLRGVLGDEDGDWAADLFGVTAAGTFEHGTSVLRLARDVDAVPELWPRWRDVRARLGVARAARPQPGRDDKVVAEWNGLAVTALAHYHAVASAIGGAEHAGIAADALRGAIATAELLLGTHLVDGRLRRVSRGGTVGVPVGVLADYGCVAEGLVTLHQVTGDGRWLDAAGRLLDTALDGFGDGEGGFHDTAADAEALVTRPADPTDNATPSGSSALCAALVAYTALTGETRYREAAEAALARVVPILAEHPRFTGYAAAVAEAVLAGPVEVAVVGPAGAREELVNTAVRLAPAGAVVVAGDPDQPGVPLLASRPLVGGAPAAYVCRGFVCERPVTDPADLAAQLAPA